MATLKQIEANRKNALLSTGPVTDAAKAAVRFNALKSGIDAASQIIPGEDPEQLKTLAEGFIQSWKPAGQFEQELVDQLIDDAWRLRRLRRAETEIWTSSIENHRSCRVHNPDAEAGTAFDGWSNTLSRLQRLVTSIKRSQHQAIVDLERLQAARRKAEAQSAEPVNAALTTSPEAQTEGAEQSQLDPLPPHREPSEQHNQGPWPPVPGLAFPLPAPAVVAEINNEDRT